jgi:hypothetical protein
MKKITMSLALTLFVFLSTHANLSLAQTGWVNISGTVSFEENMVVAMVLANGEYMFSGGDTPGQYDLEVPLDGNGQITLFAFASEFAPYSVVLTPSGSVITQDILMERSDSTRLPQVYLAENLYHATDDSLRTITGNIKFGTEFVCSMVIANGQNTFTCDDYGSFELHVPLDAEGNITFFCFIDGFSPFQIEFNPDTLPTRDILLSSEAITYHQRLLGEWRFQSPDAGFDRIYTLARITEESQSAIYPQYVIGSDETDNIETAAAYVGVFNDLEIYIVQDPDILENGSIIYNMFEFIFIDDNSVVGSYYQVDPELNQIIGDIYNFTGTKLSDL